MAVAAVLAQQRGGVPEDGQRFGRPVEGGVGGEQGPALGRRRPGDAGGQLGRLLDGRAVGLGAERPAQGGDRSVPAGPRATSGGAIDQASGRALATRDGAKL